MVGLLGSDVVCCVLTGQALVNVVDGVKHCGNLECLRQDRCSDGHGNWSRSRQWVGVWGS